MYALSLPYTKNDKPVITKISYALHNIGNLTFSPFIDSDRSLIFSNPADRWLWITPGVTAESNVTVLLHNNGTTAAASVHYLGWNC